MTQDVGLPAVRSRYCCRENWLSSKIQFVARITAKAQPDQNMAVDTHLSLGVVL